MTAVKQSFLDADQRRSSSAGKGHLDFETIVKRPRVAVRSSMRRSSFCSLSGQNKKQIPEKRTREYVYSSKNVETL
jgi:hypothetical protein